MLSHPATLAGHHLNHFVQCPVRWHVIHSSCHAANHHHHHLQNPLSSGRTEAQFPFNNSSPYIPPSPSWHPSPTVLHSVSVCSQTERELLRPAPSKSPTLNIGNLGGGIGIALWWEPPKRNGTLLLKTQTPQPWLTMVGRGVYKGKNVMTN